MDPQLAQLILTALQSDSDLSGLTNAVKNPLMQYLSGSYNPMVGMQGNSSELLSKYAGNPEFPGVNMIIDLIQNGADKFQVMTAAKSAANRDIFDSTTFDQLAGQLWDDYNENRPGGSNDFWSKNMLSRPEDVYSESNLPSKAGLLNYLRDYQSKETNLLTEAERLRKQADEADKEYKSANPVKTDISKARTGRQRNISTASNPEVNIGQAKTGRQRNISSAKNPEVNIGQAKTGRQRNISEAGRSKGFTPEETLEKKNRSIQAGYDAKAAEDELKMEQYIKKQFVKGYLDRAQERGITPLNDQLRQMAQFLPKS
jgi:hypothetical protein